jgi:hypothetical protein
MSVLSDSAVTCLQQRKDLRSSSKASRVEAVRRRVEKVLALDRAEGRLPVGEMHLVRVNAPVAPVRYREGAWLLSPDRPFAPMTRSCKAHDAFGSLLAMILAPRYWIISLG